MSAPTARGSAGWHPWRDTTARSTALWDYAVLAAVATGHDTGLALWKLFGRTARIYLALTRNETAGLLERHWKFGRVHYRVSRAGAAMLTHNTTATGGTDG